MCANCGLKCTFNCLCNCTMYPVAKCLVKVLGAGYVVHSGSCYVVCYVHVHILRLIEELCLVTQAQMLLTTVTCNELMC